MTTPPTIYILLREDKEVMRSHSIEEVLMETVFFPAGETLRIESWIKEDGYLLRDEDSQAIEITINKNTLNFPSERSTTQACPCRQYGRQGEVYEKNNILNV